MQIASALSMLSAGSILLVITALSYRKKVFLQLISAIALCDVLSALSLVIGGTPSYSFFCYLQGIANNYFSLASFFWTITLAYQVSLVISYQRVQRDLYAKMQWYNWSIPLFLSLIPLSTSTYANDDETPGWCFFHEQSRYSGQRDLQWLPVFWFIFSFYLWIYIAIFYLFYVSARSLHTLYYDQSQAVRTGEDIEGRGEGEGEDREGDGGGAMEDTHKKPTKADAHVVVERIIYYPLIVIVCWVVSSVIALSRERERVKGFLPITLP